MRSVDVVSPVDGSVYVSRDLATDTEIARVLDRAVTAQPGWRTAGLHDRAQACQRLIDRMVERAGQLGEELTWQMGRPIAQTPNEITRGFQERGRHMAEIAERCLADVPLPEKEGFERFIRREPLGVVLVVAPWNYPYLTAVNAVIPAIMAGNSVVLKVSSQTPLVAERWAEAADAANMPDDVIQYVHCDHDGVARMIGDERVAFVAFTGSVDGGRAVQQAASGRFIATNLELGGKDPAYVYFDADVERTAVELADGVFFNAGQSCCGVERIYVHQRVYDEFVEALVEEARKLRLGNPLDPDMTLGPMVRTSAAEFVRGQVGEAVGQGAKALLDDAGEPGTPYLGPQILVDVDHSMRVMTEETFGPVVGVMPVADEREAVRLMNDSAYGLTASIWTSDIEAAKRIGDQVETGTWFVNRCDYLDPGLAWTGVKDSGRGVSLSALGYEALTRPKSFHMRTEL